MGSNELGIVAFSVLSEELCRAEKGCSEDSTLTLTHARLGCATWRSIGEKSACLTIEPSLIT